MITINIATFTTLWAHIYTKDALCVPTFHVFRLNDTDLSSEVEFLNLPTDSYTLNIFIVPILSLK